MEFYSVEINSINFKTFKTFELAFKFVQELQGEIKIYHEEFPDDFHGVSDAHCYKTLVWQSN